MRLNTFEVHTLGEWNTATVYNSEKKQREEVTYDASRVVSYDSRKAADAAFKHYSESETCEGVLLYELDTETGEWNEIDSWGE